MASPNSGNLLLGAGSVFLNLYDSGALTNERHIGNCSSFVLSTIVEKVATNTIKLKSTDLPSYISKGPRIEGSFTLEELNIENLALIMYGTRGADYVQTQGSIVGKDVTCKKGYAFKLLNTSDATIFNVTVTKLMVGSTQYTEGQDYKVYSKLGMILIPDTSTITDGATLSIDYNWPAMLVKQLQPGSQIDLEAKLLFIGDPIVGPAHIVEYNKVQLWVENDGVPLIGENFADIKISFTVLDASNSITSDVSAPYTILQI